MGGRRRHSVSLASVRAGLDPDPNKWSSRIGFLRCILEIAGTDTPTPPAPPLGEDEDKDPGQIVGHVKGICIFTDILDKYSTTATVHRKGDKHNVLLVQYPDQHKEILKLFSFSRGEEQEIQEAQTEYDYAKQVSDLTPYVAKPVKLSKLEQKERTYIEMLFEYGGESLYKMTVENKAGVTADTVLEWAKQSLAGMRAAEKVGVFHSDIKPENMVFDGTTVKLIDFGGAVRMSRHSLQVSRPSKIAAYTECYLPPEIFSMRKDNPQHGKIDVYCWGMSFYQILTHKTCKELDDECNAYKNGDEGQYNKFLDMVQKITLKGKRGEALTSRLVPILVVALSYNPHDRPTFACMCKLVDAIKLA